MKFHKKLLPLINYCNSNKYQIISGILLFLLIPNLLLSTGINYQIDGIPYSTILNSPKNSKNSDFGYSYIFDQDAKALQWFKINSDKGSQIFSDGYGKRKITSLINEKSNLYQKSLLDQSEQSILEENVYLSVTNEYFHTFRDTEGKEIKITQFGYFLNQKNKIYANGAVLYK